MRRHRSLHSWVARLTVGLASIVTALPMMLVWPEMVAAQPTLVPPPTQKLPDFDSCLRDIKPEYTTDETWPQDRLRYESAWRYSMGAGVTVAVVDTGVDGNHPQLRGNVLGVIDMVTPGQPAPLQDCAGHGTFVAGIIAAHPVAGSGFAGVAPGATILPIRQTWSEEDGDSRVLAAAIVRAVDENADIINVSITTPATSPELLEAVKYASSRGVLLVAAAGNVTGNESPEVRYPAAYSRWSQDPGVSDSVIAVTGTTRDDAIGQQARYGPEIDVSAPGDAVISLRAHDNSGKPGLFLSNGTSFAAPFVTGLAALIKSYYPDLSPAEIKARIVGTTDRPSTNLPSEKLGWGVINPVNAMTAVLPEKPRNSSGPVVQRLDTIPRPAVSDLPTRNSALAIFGGALFLAVVVITVALVVPRGRHRGWRPGRRAVDRERDRPS